MISSPSGNETSATWPSAPTALNLLLVVAAAVVVDRPPSMISITLAFGSVFVVVLVRAMPSGKFAVQSRSRFLLSVARNSRRATQTKSSASRRQNQANLSAAGFSGRAIKRAARAGNRHDDVDRSRRDAASR